MTQATASTLAFTSMVFGVIVNKRWLGVPPW